MPPSTQISNLLAPFTWRTGPSFETIVTDAAGRTAVPVLPTKAQATPSQIANGRYVESFIERVVKPWGDLAAVSGKKYGFPAPWILAVIEAEAAGKQRAHASSGAVGLMQLLSIKGNHSDQELMDNPGLNIDLGTSFLAQLSTTVQKKLGKMSFPDVLSAYNCGPGCWAKPKTLPCVGSSNTRGPWAGLCEQGVGSGNDGYISRAVSVANTATGVDFSSLPLPAPTSGKSSTISVVPAFIGVGIAVWLAKKFL